ncbi:MAG: hypothetical protein O3C21_12155, partial [Verrucomicrobia bacterium]|nr:hypothetical protein [Verrucomicrobiota bacterium]
MMKFAAGKHVPGQTEAAATDGSSENTPGTSLEIEPNGSPPGVPAMPLVLSPSGSMFPTTRWALMLAAHSATEVSARKALSELCEMYWFPLYAYARSYGCTPHDAEDATQGFFCDFLGRQDFSKAEENKGKLRDFLRASMRNYLNKGRRKARAERRGGGAIHISIDQQSAEG